MGQQLFRVTLKLEPPTKIDVLVQNSVFFFLLQSELYNFCQASKGTLGTRHDVAEGGIFRGEETQNSTSTWGFGAIFGPGLKYQVSCKKQQPMSYIPKKTDWFTREDHFDFKDFERNYDESREYG